MAVAIVAVSAVASRRRREEADRERIKQMNKDKEDLNYKRKEDFIKEFEDKGEGI